MRWIRLIATMSGTRANGERYPVPGVPFEVADWEADNLIHSQVAVQASAPAAVKAEPEQDPEPVPDSPVSVRSDTAAGPVQPLPEPDTDAMPPAPGDPKQAWVDYAVSQGASPQEASTLTKNQLQQAFGGRLLSWSQ